MCSGYGLRLGYPKPRLPSVWELIGLTSADWLGPRNPTVVTLWHIAKTLEVKLAHFFEEEGRARRDRR
jgi:hypothetical protein